VEVELFGLMSFDVHPIMGIFERTCHILSFPLNLFQFCFLFFFGGTVSFYSGSLFFFLNVSE